MAAGALRSLIEGNLRFAEGKSLNPRWDTARRLAVLSIQKPLAAVLTCCDARVPPEILFDQGLGDIFVIRTAGNIAGPAGLGSLEYAVEHLKVPLVLVLGHQRCSSVAAAVEGGSAPGKMAAIVEVIRPVVDTVRDQAGDLLNNSIDANIAAEVERVKSTSKLLADYARRRKVEVIGARYNLESGLVDWLTGTPEMIALFPKQENSADPQPIPPTLFAPAPTVSLATDETGPVNTAPAEDSMSGFLGTHTVKRGETLYGIGLAYGVNPWAIARENHIPNADLIHPGQRLKIPDIRWRNMPPGRPAERQF